MIPSIEASSTFTFLPLIGKIACVKRDLPCLAEPPAELPSTINSSEILGSLLVLSANLPRSEERRVGKEWRERGSEGSETREGGSARERNDRVMRRQHT